MITWPNKRRAASPESACETPSMAQELEIVFASVSRSRVIFRRKHDSPVMTNMLGRRRSVYGNHQHGERDDLAANDNTHSLQTSVGGSIDLHFDGYCSPSVSGTGPTGQGFR